LFSWPFPGHLQKPYRDSAGFFCLQDVSIMRNGKSSANLQLKVPTYLPLSEAAQKYDLSEQVLIQLIQAGKMEAVRLPSG
jgi:hypothetical protein